jgi:hypothetical protein
MDYEAILGVDDVQLYTKLKDLDYSGYEKIRKTIQSYAMDAGSSRVNFNVFWSRKMAKFYRDFNYNIPESDKGSAPYSRKQRRALNDKMRIKQRKNLTKLETKEQPEEEGEWIEGEFYPASSFQALVPKDLT